MMCPKCAGDTFVVSTNKGNTNVRTRKCKACVHLFFTVETIRFDIYWKNYVSGISTINMGDNGKNPNICPVCGADAHVTRTSCGTVNLRNRKCVKCGHTFITLEAILYDEYWQFYAKESVSMNPKDFKKEEK